MESELFWKNFLQYISSKVSNISFNIWFKDAKLVSVTNGVLTIEVSSNYIKQHITSYYEDVIEEAISATSDISYTFDIVTPDEIKQNEPVIIEETTDMPKYKDNNTNLNPTYTFENFVVGDTNRLAATVGHSVAEQPGKLYNPLFIYGKSGLGKTHLMHAIGNFVKENSDKAVLYITSETFISDFIQINKKDEDKLDLVQHFKDKYRNVDVLIIDDIQLLGGAPKTQDEFFNTFNFLHSLNKQIIISSDRSPDDLKVLEDRLRTRFTWGLTVNITPPDYELRLKIIKNKISGHDVSKLIKPEVLEYIANNCESDVRYLEGSIRRLFAYAAMYSPPEINLDFAIEALKDYFGSSVYSNSNISKIQKAVADYFNITVENLKSKKRTADINNARQIAMYLCRMITEETTTRIGLEFGNRDHSTVLHAIEKVSKDIKNNEDLKHKLNEIKNKIN